MKEISARSLAVYSKNSSENSRNVFHRDYGMIVHSNFFKRLAKKTQVYTLPENDHVRSRLTHSIEVSQIGRQLARQLAYQLKNHGFLTGDIYWSFLVKFEELTASACLAHDIGHAPFGHSGAKILGESLTRKYGLLDGFDDNKQVVHILLNEFFYEGIDPTACLVAATLKKPELEKNCYSTDKFKLKSLMNELGLENVRHPAGILMEAADDIAYICSDLEDYVDYFIQFSNHQVLNVLAEMLEALPILDSNYQETRESWIKLITKMNGLASTDSDSNAEQKDKLVEQFRNNLMKSMIMHVFDGIKSVVSKIEDINELPDAFEQFIDEKGIKKCDKPKRKADLNLLYWNDRRNKAGQIYYDVKRTCYDEFILKQDKVVEQDLLANNVIGEMTDALKPLSESGFDKQYEFKFLSQSMRHHVSFAHRNPELIDPRRAVANYIAGMSDRYCIDALSKIRPINARGRAA